MNAKKLLSVLVLASAGLGLVACGAATKTATRAEALTALDKISAKVTAASYKAPTTLHLAQTATADKSAQITTDVDTAAVYGHTVYTTDYKNTKGVTLAAAGTEIWAYKSENKFYAVSKIAGTFTNWSADADFGVAAALAKKISNGVGSAASMAKFIRNFADGATGIVTGATVRPGTVMKAESYTTAGDGNVTLDITPNYTGEGDEHMTYVYKNYIVASAQNDLHANVVNYTWSGKVTATLPTEVGTSVGTEALGVAILALL